VPSNRLMEALAREAIEMFGGEEHGIFSTACVQGVVKALTGHLPEARTLEYVMGKCPRLVRLKGGCHWMLIPGGYEKHTD
jgi:hypothetical protein